MSDPTPAETFEAICRVANAKRKIRESGPALFNANMRKRNGSKIYMQHCAECGETTHHDVWYSFDDGHQTEHHRCQTCGKHMTYPQ